MLYQSYPFCCGGSTRTNDLQVMSLASYQLLHSAISRTRCFLFASAKVELSNIIDKRLLKNIFQCPKIKQEHFVNLYFCVTCTLKWLHSNETFPQPVKKQSQSKEGIMDYRPIIESPYSRTSWQLLLHDIFGNKAEFYTMPHPIKADPQLANTALHLGTICLTDGMRLGVYEVQLTSHVDIQRNRRALRDMLLHHWRETDCAGAFMFCFHKGESLLRFSYVSEVWQFDDKGEYKKVSTDTRRFTYLLGEGRGCRTAIEQFGTLKESEQTLSDVTRAFSVEALTREFYQELFGWYQWAIAPETRLTFPNDTSTEDDDREDLETKVIRMITRIMFVWFIKQKGLVPDRIFQTTFLQTILKDFDPQSPTSGTFYNAILQNLFFATLNRAIKDEKGHRRKFAHASRRDIKTLYRYAEMFRIGEEEVIELFAQVPFLNGGLFECLDKTVEQDGVKKAYNYDGFSRNDSRFADGRFRNRAVVPNVLFFHPERGLIPILSRYNFTIEENTPEEQQVALDPELLGKVFENLLGAYNPETRETARNQSGSFYTPREVVSFMVDEALKAYLEADKNPLVKEIFSPSFVREESQAEAYEEIVKRLKRVRILDPACGSGAFPMGLLNRLVELICRLSPQAREDVYRLKMQIIERCIYGADIQCIATQITKLRFFISLICDCTPNSQKSNFGIPTLPNLETKFVAANSLIQLKKQDRRDLFEDPEIEQTKQELIEVRHEHFLARTTYSKMTLRKKDSELRTKLAHLLSENKDYAPADALQMAAWNPYDQNAVASFFDPEWMFGPQGGFDIIIGNPPYVQLQNNGGELAQLYANSGYKSFARTGDVYCLFYERGFQLLRSGGHLCFITSNKWMRAGYGEKLRLFFARETNPTLLLDFAGVKVFESATVDTNILLFAKAPNEGHTLCAVANRQTKDGINNLSSFLQQRGALCAFVHSDSWVILSPIEQSIKRKIEAVGTPLKDWDIRINYGIKTGYNDAFIISTEKRDEILSNCQTEDERTRTAELIRPILRGRDIKRYGYEWAGLWLIATFPSRHYDIDQYPAVKDYLLSFAKDVLVANGCAWVAEHHLHDFCQQKLAQTGKFIEIEGKRIRLGNSDEKARKKTNNKWYETQDAIGYWEDFTKPKILWKRVGSILRFSYDDNNTLGLDSTCFATGANIEYVCCLLNSPMGHYLLKDAPKTGTGDLLISVQAVEPIRIPKISSEESREFKSLLDELLKPQTSSKEIEKKVKHKVFALYHLSEEEQIYICTNFV